MSRGKKVDVVSEDTLINAAEKVLQDTLKNLTKKYGSGSVGTGAVLGHKNFGVIKTGVIGLDLLTGRDGFPRGKIVEIYGPESLGKSTLVLTIIAAAQRDGLKCAFVDFEHAFDTVYASAIGVNLDELIYVEPDSAEDGLEIIRQLIATGQVAVIGVDSVAALSSEDEQSKEMRDQSMGVQARMMSKFMRCVVGPAAKNGTLVLMTNQMRQKIGVLFGDNSTTSGGLALRYYASIRIQLLSGGNPIKDGEKIIAKDIKVRMKKNKCAGTEGSEIIYRINLGKGIDAEDSLVEIASQFNVIEKSGSWYSFGDIRIGQGKDQVKKILEENKDIYNTIVEQVKLYLEKNKEITEDIEEEDEDATDGIIPDGE